MTRTATPELPMLKTYDTLAPRYDLLHGRWLRFAGGEAQAALEAAVRVEMKPSSSLLDAGCGTGKFVRRLISDGVTPAQCTVMDASIAMLERCSDLPVCKRQGLLESMPFDSESYDLVTCAWALETVDKQAQAIRELCRVLKPGGTLFLTFCAEKAPEDSIDWVMQQALKLRRTGRFMNVKSVSQNIENTMECYLRVIPAAGPAVTLFARKKRTMSFRFGDVPMFDASPDTNALDSLKQRS